MNIIEHFQNRQSARSFTHEHVPDDIIMESLEAGNLAPSAGNLQARDFIIVKDDDRKRALSKAAYSQDFLAEAPVVIVCCANLDRIAGYRDRGRELYCIQDVAAAVQNILLYLSDAGYGTCWVGAFDEEIVSDLLRLPKQVRPLTMIPVGRVRTKEEPTSRIEIEDLVHYEEW